MMSKMRTAFSASCIGLAILIGSAGSSNAAPASITPAAAVSKQAQETPAAVQKVHYRRGVRHECAYRWGWGTRGYHRCLDRHRYYKPAYNYSRSWRYKCADRWGWKTRGYYRCLRRHGY